MRLSLTLLVLGCARAASAHDHWLETEPAAPTPQQPIKVYWLVGEHLTEAEPMLLRSRHRITAAQWLTARGARHLEREAVEDAQPNFRIAAGPLPAALTVETAPRDIELTAEKFEAYLRDEGLDAIVEARSKAGEQKKPGRERYSRSLQLLVDGAGPRALLLQPKGQTLEVVPLADPFAAPGRHAFRVLFHGQPLVEHAVSIANRRNGQVETETARTDADGVVQLTVARGGDWLIHLVHMERSSEPDVEWRSFWCSLSFHRAD